MEPPGIFRLVEAHLHDAHARITLGRANYLAHVAAIPARYVYRHRVQEAVDQVCQFLQPQEIIVAEPWQTFVPPGSTCTVLPKLPTPSDMNAEDTQGDIHRP